MHGSMPKCVMTSYNAYKVLMTINKLVSPSKVCSWSRLSLGLGGGLPGGPLGGGGGGIIFGWRGGFYICFTLLNAPAFFCKFL